MHLRSPRTRDEPITAVYSGHPSKGEALKNGWTKKNDPGWDGKNDGVLTQCVSVSSFLLVKPRVPPNHSPDGLLKSH